MNPGFLFLALKTMFILQMYNLKKKNAMILRKVYSGPPAPKLHITLREIFGDPY